MTREDQALVDRGERPDQLSVAPQPPAPSGLDSYRFLYVPPVGEQPGMPAEHDPTLHEAPGSGIARVQRKAIEKFDEIGYRFVRAERRPDANGRGEWPWEEITVEQDGGNADAR